MVYSTNVLIYHIVLLVKTCYSCDCKDNMIVVSTREVMFYEKSTGYVSCNGIGSISNCRMWEQKQRREDTEHNRFGVNRKESEYII